MHEYNIQSGSFLLKHSVVCNNWLSALQADFRISSVIHMQWVLLIEISSLAVRKKLCFEIERKIESDDSSLWLLYSCGQSLHIVSTCCAIQEEIHQGKQVGEITLPYFLLLSYLYFFSSWKELLFYLSISTLVYVDNCFGNKRVWGNMWEFLLLFLFLSAGKSEVVANLIPFIEHLVHEFFYILIFWLMEVFDLIQCHYLVFSDSRSRP